MSSTKPRRTRAKDQGEHVYVRYDGQYELGLRLADSSGETKLRWIGPFPTAKEARAERDRLKGTKAVVAANPRLTFNEASAEWWKGSVLAHRHGQTPATYEGHLKHLRAQFGPKKLKDIRVEDVRHYLAGLDCADHTRAGRITVLSAVFRYAISRLGHDHNPVRMLDSDERPPAKSRRKAHVLTPAESEALIQGDAFLTLVRRTGLRKGEALGLTRADLDLERGSLTVNKQRNRQGALVEPKTDNSRRTIPITADTCRILRRHLMGHTDPLAFPLSHSGADYVLAQAAKRAGIEDVTLHDLRHTHASELIAAGQDVVRVARRLGNDKATLLKTYAHEFDMARHFDHDRAELEAMESCNNAENSPASSEASDNVFPLANRR